MWSLFGPQPRPALISSVFERDTTSREARSFAVGAYLPIGTSAALFAGGVVRWLAERGQTSAHDDETSPPLKLNPVISRPDPQKLILRMWLLGSCSLRWFTARPNKARS